MGNCPDTPAVYPFDGLETLNMLYTLPDLVAELVIVTGKLGAAEDPLILLFARLGLFHAIKLETVEKIYAILDSIYNLIEKKLTEKDYVIENLTNENIELKKDLIKSIMTNEKDKEKENIYFY